MAIHREEKEKVSEILDKYTEDITEVLSAVANKSRLQLLTSLLYGSREFSELKEIVGLSKTALAHHLDRLVKIGLMKNTRRGKYELSPDGGELLGTVSLFYANSKRRRELESERVVSYIQRTLSKKRVEPEEEFKVQIIRLMPMRVVSFQAISETPENDAWAKMCAWARSKGLLEDIDRHPVYGFNNPNPRPGQKRYGYEFWMQVNPDFETDEDIVVKDFSGGLFAVTRCFVRGDPWKTIPESWKNLRNWVLANGFKYGRQVCLEKAVNPEASEDEYVLDLYFSIAED